MKLTRYFNHVRCLLMIGIVSLGNVYAQDVNPKIAQAISAVTAQEAVELATNEVLSLIETSREYANSDPERFYTEAEVLLRPVIDFPRFARNVMGVHYKRASPEQRERFAESFKWSLVRTYALALTEFHSGEVNVLPPRRKSRNPNKVNVSMEIKLQGSSYSAVYVMQRKDDVWKMQNLIIEGVNIGLNYKSQFSAAMKKTEYAGDLDAVISAWTNFIGASEKTATNAGQ